MYFRAIVFLVAGPAIGFTLSQISNLISGILWDKEKYNFAREYHQIRFKCKPNEVAEFDNIDARITFSRSTGLGLMIIGLLMVSYSSILYSSAILSATHCAPILLEANNQSSQGNSSTALDRISSPGYILNSIVSLIVYATGLLLILGATIETVHVRDVLVLRKIERSANEKDGNDYKKEIGDDKFKQLKNEGGNRTQHAKNSIWAIIIIGAVVLSGAFFISLL
jgi:hypothetical protein